MSTNVQRVYKKTAISAVSSWSFLGSVFLHVFLFKFLFFPALQSPAIVISNEASVLWFTPFILSGDAGYMAEIRSQPADAVTGQSKTAKPVSIDKPEQAIAPIKPPAIAVAPASPTADDTVALPANNQGFLEDKEIKGDVHHEVKASAEQPQKGLVFPHLSGDLKLVLTGAALPELTITFKEFGLSRRNRPFSRIEAANRTLVVPVMAQTKEQVREVVIEKARPGVYTITAEPVSGMAEFTCLLKLYEGTSEVKVKKIGSSAIVRKMVILKLLMPEGIIWDDHSAFTGSMEDSGSITKFNTDTGLMWKEYAD